MAQASSTMTLVIGFAALQRLADPAGAVDDATHWSDAVGVAGDQLDELKEFLVREGVEPGFVAGEFGLVDGLVGTQQRVTTDRHVFVGTTDETRATAESVGWEYLDVEEAAAKAGWSLTTEDRDS